MTNVVKFQPVEAGENYRLDPDEILEKAKGQDFSRLLIIAEHEDGRPYVAGSANAGECLILMEIAKRVICFGEDE